MNVTEFKREEIVLILESIKATRQNFEKNINQLKKSKSESLEKIINETLESYNQIETKCLYQLKHEREQKEKQTIYEVKISDKNWLFIEVLSDENILIELHEKDDIETLRNNINIIVIDEKMEVL